LVVPRLKGETRIVFSFYKVLKMKSRSSFYGCEKIEGEIRRIKRRT